MCLVSYIPLPDGYLISSNRDEAPSRANTPLIKDTSYPLTTIYYPKDHKGGSWLVVAQDGRAVCILNGAFIRHRRKNNYRLSRGIMCKSYFSYENTQDFLESYDFTDMEPFTMVIKDKIGLYELRWDAVYRYIEILDPESLHVWSSCTLYDDPIIEKRTQLVKQMYEKETGDVASRMKKIHLTGNIGDPENDFVMRRGHRVATISHSYVKITKDTGVINIENLIRPSEEEKVFALRN